MPELDVEAAGAIDDLTATDARILDCLNEGRNVPSNISDEIDRHTKHVSERLAVLRDAGLVQKVGRDSVSLHEITDHGQRVLDTYREFQSALRQ